MVTGKHNHEGDMPSSHDDSQRYEMTIKMFGAQSEPTFETPEQQRAVWGRPWGCDSDVGRLRVVLMHRPDSELEVVDPDKRIESIGTFGDLEEGWYWQSDTIPPISEMQAQHDALVEILRAEGVEVVFLEGVSGGRLKSCYTRDSAIAIKGGATDRRGVADPGRRAHPRRLEWLRHPHRRQLRHGGRRYGARAGQRTPVPVPREAEGAEDPDGRNDARG
jgi:hypothetical protein